MPVGSPPLSRVDRVGLDHLRRGALPALLLAPHDVVVEIGTRLDAAGVRDAVARHDSGPTCDDLLSLIALQGTGDSTAFASDARHGGVRLADIEAALRGRRSCPRLQSFWRFPGGGSREGFDTCAEPDHRPRCPPLVAQGPPQRRGLALFVRDVGSGDLVAWLDANLAPADPR